MSTTSNMGIELIDGSDYISPDPINKAFTILDALGVDYIVEQGTSGEWWYRKWNSGRAECGIDSKTFATKTSTNWASGWGLAGTYTFGAYPFSFISSPITLIQFRYESGNSSGAMIHIHANTGTAPLTTSPKFSLADASHPRTYTNPVCGIYVTGRYK